jgi:hypothetical protein
VAFHHYSGSDLFNLASHYKVQSLSKMRHTEYDSIGHTKRAGINEKIRNAITTAVNVMFPAVRHGRRTMKQKDSPQPKERQKKKNRAQE